MLIGYARVSTTDQNLALQRHALTEAGCEKIFTEHVSGAAVDRPTLVEALQTVREGDTLVVWKLDCLARSVRQLLDTRAIRRCGDAVRDPNKECHEQTILWLARASASAGLRL